jgi:IclR family pca regulon transcriptional regulator
MLARHLNPVNTTFSQTDAHFMARKKRGDISDGYTEAEKRENPLFVRSVEKAHLFLNTFDAGHRKQSLSQMADRAGTDLSTAQRFAYTLEQLGLLRKDPVARLYELAPQMLNLGFRYLQGNEIIERAMPTMLHLNKTTEAAVNLMVPDGVDVVYAHRLQSRHLINPEIMIGARLPMFATASGLAIMARLSREEVDDILGRSDLRAYTAHTQTDPSTICERLESIREKGYAVAYQETALGDISIAAAILTSSRKPLATIAISSSTLVTTLAEAEESFSPLVAAAAASLSQR